MTETQPNLDALVAQLMDNLATLALGGAGRLAPVFILATVAIAFAVYLVRRPGKGFFAWAFPREIWFHRSHWVDIKLVVFMRVMSLVVAFVSVATSTSIGVFVSGSVGEAVGGPGSQPTPWHPVALAIMLFVIVDFCAYWCHRLHHENAVLWPFHAVHHSAEVMTPITVYRKHPVYDLLNELLTSATVGLIMGLALGLVIGQVSVATLGGINVVYYAFNMAGANLRHSHIWLSFGPVMEHLVISPAQHQVHHSLDPRHHNKNYGEALAIWDWLFGTLYVTREPEPLEFGLSDAQGNRIDQPHGTLRALLAEPFVASWRALRLRIKRLAKVTARERG